MEEIGVAIDENSDEYTVGDNASASRTPFNANASNGIVQLANKNAVVYAMTIDTTPIIEGNIQENDVPTTAHLHVNATHQLHVKQV